jgi:catechol 2,3-dioxygenase-like lactoylglutathione lyase family enzyme
MKRSVMTFVACSLILSAALIVPRTLAGQPTQQPTPGKGAPSMRLGNFSVSLAVKDLAASRAFYERLGFHVVGGNGKSFSILKNEASVIGLFQGMFDKNILTFNPGWDANCATLPDFDDVREIQKLLEGQGVALATQADASSTGPASIVVFDPDGNQILIDQHVPRPGK